MQSAATTTVLPTCRFEPPFTGKERDAESWLDYFGARYFSGAHGRFISPDPFDPNLHSEDSEQFRAYLEQPQNWNRYAYVWNNPLKFIDPTGASVELIGETDEERKKALAVLQKSLGNQTAASRLYIDEKKVGDKTRYFVGILGDVGQFMKLSETSHDLAQSCSGFQGCRVRADKPGFG